MVALLHMKVCRLKNCVHTYYWEFKILAIYVMCLSEVDVQGFIYITEILLFLCSKKMLIEAVCCGNFGDIRYVNVHMRGA